MKKWVLKAIIQKLISWLPNSHRVNFWFQKYITKGVQLSDKYFGDKLIHAEDHIKHFRAHQAQGQFSSLELGTGWYPVVPLAMYLSGARNATSIDLNSLMTKESFSETIEKFQEWFAAGKLKNWEPYFLSERVSQLQKIEVRKSSYETLLVIFNFEYRVGDAQNLQDEAGTYDLIHSNNVFEHVHPQVLSNILKEFKRVLKQNGLMSHFIDMSDHFAHLDSSITIYNFLRFSPEAWQRIDNEVQPQNRWRLSDYESLYKSLALQISEKEARPGSITDLDKITLHPSYNSKAKKDLAVSHVHLVNTI
jgi:SAM-dependent methyltransferase